MTVESSCVLNSCCVCLESNTKLDRLSSSEHVNTKSWLSKLRSCVDKIVWSKDYCICSTCSEQLDIVYDFYQLCLESNEKREQTLRILSENTKSEIYSIDAGEEKVHNGNLINLSEDNSRALFCKCCDSLGFKNQFELDEHCEKLHVSKTICVERACHDVGNDYQQETQNSSVNISNNLEPIHNEKFKSRRGRKPKNENENATKSRATTKRNIKIPKRRISNRRKKNCHPLNTLSESANDISQDDKEICKENSQQVNVEIENQQSSPSVDTHQDVNFKSIKRKCKLQRSCIQQKDDNNDTINETSDTFSNLKSKRRYNHKKNLREVKLGGDEDEFSHNTENSLNDKFKEEIKLETKSEKSITDLGDASIGENINLDASEECESNFKVEVGNETMEEMKNSVSSDICDDTSDDGVCQDTDEDDDANIETFSKPKGSPRSKVNKRNNMSFKCDLCGSTFTFCIKFLEHSVMVHNLDEKEVRPYACTHCPKRFNKHSTMKDHAKSHDPDRNEMCSYCGKAFKTKRALTIHEKQHLNLREYQCPHCPKRFNTHKNRNTHIYILHSDPNTWKHVCNICEKKFALKTTYIAHMRIHSNFKQFACHLCEKRFTDRTTLRNHLTSHSNVREHKCSECGKEYKNIKYLKVHMAKAHNIGNVKLPVRVKKHFCHMCPKAFCYKNKLLRHIYTHTGERPFPCSVCDKRFTDRSYAVQHMKTMHNIIPEATHDDV